MDKDLKETTEDILRITAEKGRDVVSVPILKEDISLPDEIFIKAINELEREGLVRIENHETVLTRKGKEKARKILDRHEAIEKYFSEILRDPQPHNAAHALEHFVADETIRRMEDFLTVKGRGRPVPDFPPGKEILIIAVEITDRKVLGKIVSLGLTPGSKVRIEEKIPDAFIFNIGGRKVAIADEIAKKIFAVIEDEAY